ncbi:MAG: hypothetical protein ACE5HE_07615 [Phycisphaerae bacterium]
MSLATLSDHAGQVIVGTVQSVRSYWADSPRRIESEITLAQVVYLKGALPGSEPTFTLIVPGGSVGQTHMQITDAPTFGVGEEWILFLLPTYKTFPVVGLSQGALRVLTDASGVKRVTSASAHPLKGIDQRGFAYFASSPVKMSEANAPKTVGAVDLRQAQTVTRATGVQGMPLDEFLAMLQPILDGSADHNLTEPAGRRVLVDYVPVPLAQSGKRVRGR